MSIEKLKRETFLKMVNSGEIAHNSDNEEWVNALIQIGADFIKKEYEEKLRWIPVEEKLPEVKKFEPNQSRFRQSEDIELKLKSGRITIGYYDIPTANFIYHDSNFDKVVEWRCIL